MSRYIDADALKQKWLFRGKDGKPYRDEIDAMPTADVVEVVRCKGCKWYGIDELKSDGTVDRRYKPSACYLYRKYREETYFCADGERREQ